MAQPVSTNAARIYVKHVDPLRSTWPKSPAPPELDVTTDQRLCVNQPKFERIENDSEARRIWKRFHMVAGLLNGDHKVIIRLMNSLTAVSNGARHGH